MQTWFQVHSHHIQPPFCWVADESSAPGCCRGQTSPKNRHGPFNCDGPLMRIVCFNRFGTAKGSFPRNHFVLLFMLVALASPHTSCVCVCAHTRSSSHSCILHCGLHKDWGGGRGPWSLTSMGNDGPSAQSHVLMMLTENQIKTTRRSQRGVFVAPCVTSSCESCDLTTWSMF